MKQLKRLITSAMMLMLCSLMYAQKREVKGIVVDQAGEAILGASIMEKGTTNGVITGLDGDFKISVQQGATLVISYIGYVTQEVPAATDMKVVMKDDAMNLQEVVVTGYTTQR